MEIVTKPCIAAMLLLLVGAPQLHHFLHRGDGGADSRGAVHGLSNDITMDRHTVTSLPEASLQVDEIHLAIPAIHRKTAEQFLATDASTNSDRSVDTALIEVGPPLNVDESAGWEREEYVPEINIGEHFSADTFVTNQFSVPKEAINVEKELSKQYLGVIDIGPEMEVGSYR